ncbi:MAG: hypothetical protein AUF76_17630 [Acidobacteria bacterium 13_1_20CM_2_65_9]|nr:MAG: hypothetical protein AUF76_17630 [Acidobacteria bacterium 13_1_20CM_2_65_9]
MPIPSLLLAAALVSTGLPPVHVALAFGSEPTLPPAVAAAAVHEAADIWSRYRVVVDRTMPCASAPDEAIVLTVRAGRSRIPSALDTPTVLGAINFAEDGTPYSILTVFFDLLLQSVGLARLGDVGEDRWPPELRRRAVGRALGRVIAHEIGHYLLGSRGHSSNGLMRAVQPFGELLGQSGAGFLLSRADEQRLARSVVR